VSELATGLGAGEMTVFPVYLDAIHATARGVLLEDKAGQLGQSADDPGRGVRELPCHIQLLAARPWLPVEEEGRLNDPVLRENFINRVIVYRRLQKLEAAGAGIADLIDFHSCHKLLVQSHSPDAAQRLGRLLANPLDRSFGELVEAYRRQIMTAMRKTVPRRRHAMVMERIMGYLRGHLDTGDREELRELLGRYRRGEMPLVVPVTMLRHYLRRLPENHAARQVYLTPHPDALALRNAI